MYASIFLQNWWSNDNATVNALNIKVFSCIVYVYVSCICILQKLDIMM